MFTKTVAFIAKQRYDDEVNPIKEFDGIRMVKVKSKVDYICDSLVQVNCMKNIRLVLLGLAISCKLSACVTSENTEDKIQAYIEKADNYYENEDYEQSIYSLEQAMDLSVEEYGEKSKETADIYLKLAMASTSLSQAEDYAQAAEYGLKSCQAYLKQTELDSKELDEFRMFKNEFQRLYEQTPLEETKDFESWFEEQISNSK